MDLSVRVPASEKRSFVGRVDVVQEISLLLMKNGTETIPEIKVW